jgi:hypothetical protein
MSQPCCTRRVLDRANRRLVSAITRVWPHGPYTCTTTLRGDISYEVRHSRHPQHSGWRTGNFEMRYPQFLTPFYVFCRQVGPQRFRCGQGESPPEQYAGGLCITTQIPVIDWLRRLRQVPRPARPLRSLQARRSNLRHCRCVCSPLRRLRGPQRLPSPGYF